MAAPKERIDKILRTVADELVELVAKHKRLSVDEAAKKLKMQSAVIQSLVDFLVEERVFGIEYKFTTPYIYLYKEGIREAKGKKEKSFTKELITKESFYEKAKEKKIPHLYIEGLWRKYLKQNLTKMREEFVRKSREKTIPEEKIEELWKKYLSYL